MKFAREIGERIAKDGHTLVYGGSNIGLMGAVASGVLDNGGKVIGVVPDVEYIKSVHYEGLTETIYTKDMADRRSKMIELADACITLPGGPGTLDEISEVICLNRLCITNIPVAFVNIKGYYDTLNAFFEKMYECDFAERDAMGKILTSDSIDKIFDFIGEK